MTAPDFVASADNLIAALREWGTLPKQTEELRSATVNRAFVEYAREHGLPRADKGEPAAILTLPPATDADRRKYDAGLARIHARRVELTRTFCDVGRDLYVGAQALKLRTPPDALFALHSAASGALPLAWVQHGPTLAAALSCVEQLKLDAQASESRAIISKPPVLSEIQWRILEQLDTVSTELSQDALVDDLHVAKTTIGEAVKELRTKGLIKDQPRRAAISDAGRQALSARKTNQNQSEPN